MAGRDDQERLRRAREQADRLRQRASRSDTAHAPVRATGDLPDGWSRVRLTAAQRRAALVEQVLVGPGGVVLVGDAPAAALAAAPDLQHEPVTTCPPTEVGVRLAALPAVLDAAHVAAARLRVEAALRSLDTGFTPPRRHDRPAASGSTRSRSRLPAAVALVAVAVLLLLLVLTGPQLADQVGGLSG